ncbi:hypothetical protein ABZ608_39420 [Streptomyces sp. NPDC013172]|uniref:hypothetical protein n=1 Tax=Streptomyces sp. NPDC013172 TaxID=3155009 RepID=UPI0033CEC28E
MTTRQSGPGKDEDTPEVLDVPDACANLRQYCIGGAELHRDQIDSYVDRSLMLVTALSPVVGYDKASAIAHRATAARCATCSASRSTRSSSACRAPAGTRTRR